MFRGPAGLVQLRFPQSCPGTLSIQRVYMCSRDRHMASHCDPVPGTLARRHRSASLWRLSSQLVWHVFQQTWFDLLKESLSSTKCKANSMKFYYAGGGELAWHHYMPVWWGKGGGVKCHREELDI